MHYTAREVEKLIFSQAGRLAQMRLAKGIRLNHLEASALLTTVLQEIIHNESPPVKDLMQMGQHILGRRQVHPHVTATLTQLQVEGTFATGTHLVTVEKPIGTDDGDMEKAFYGSSLAVPSLDVFPPLRASEYDPVNLPGAVSAADAAPITLYPGRKRIQLRVINRGTRAVYVGSHFHFMEINPVMDFDRCKSYGFHLDVSAGTFVRFNPQEASVVTLVEIGGERVIQGGSGFALGQIDPLRADRILQALQNSDYRHTAEDTDNTSEIEPFSMARDKYAKTYGPTIGDRIKLGDTNLWVKIEKDFTKYGDECTLGDGKTLRDGIGQASGCPDAECLDLVIVNAVVIDWSGIYKADIGIKDGTIAGIGKAGNPATMDIDNPAMIVGSNTDVIDASGQIVTAGGVDTHVHLICPQQANEALASGITTMFGGGTGPSTSSLAVNACAGVRHIRQMMQSCDTLPVNYGIIGKGSDSGKPGLIDQINAGVIGLKLHEDFGCTPAAIDACLSCVCDEQDIQCLIHTDSLNECGFVENTVDVIKGRAIHVYHVEGAGGGHEPDVIKLVRHSNILPSSTTPTMPYTTDTVAEHIDMAATCHRLSRENPDDLTFLTSRMRATTMAAEDVLHDIGAISIMSSDSQAMGRCGEVIVCTWKAAHLNKAQRGSLKEDEGTGADNHRVKRYVSKYTINPAITQGISHLVGSVEVGKLADLVLWNASEFGAKPVQVLKKGFISFAQMGDPNGAISTVEPLIARPMYGALHPSSSVMFVSQSSVSPGGAVLSYDLKKQIEVVKDCRKVTKQDLKFNSATPKLDVDPDTFVVTTDGLEIKSDAAATLPSTKGAFFY